jgi:hypothetical protein
MSQRAIMSDDERSQYVTIADRSDSSESSENDAPRSTSPSTRQTSLDLLMNWIDSADGPTYYSFPSLVRYLTCSGISRSSDGLFYDTMRSISKRILKVAGAPVFLADGKAFVLDVLQTEFPELSLFRIAIPEAFVESRVHPGIWVETQRFADLHSLSKMRRELKRTGLTHEVPPTELVRLLLGLG